MAQATGIVKIFTNGELQRVVEGASINLGGYKRTAVKGHAVYGFREEFMESVTKFKIAHMSDTDLIAMKDLTDATLRFECDSGITYLVTNAFTAECLELSDGNVDVEMHGDPAEEE